MGRKGTAKEIPQEQAVLPGFAKPELPKLRKRKEKNGRCGPKKRAPSTTGSLSKKDLEDPKAKLWWLDK